MHCAICTEVCPMGILTMGKEGPQALFAKACISCGHCVAVCPEQALDNSKTPLNNQVELEEFPVLTAEKAKNFLRSRRSIRCYKKKPVEKEKILELLDITRFAPTAVNTQGLSYLVVEDANILANITATTVDWMEEEGRKGTMLGKRYAGVVSIYRKTGQDMILRNAPQLILALAPQDFPLGRENTHFSLAYLELYAPALGLGTCWAGFMERCAITGYQPLVSLLQIPEDKVVTGAVMVGYPQYNYQRLVDRNPLHVSFLNKNKF